MSTTNVTASTIAHLLITGANGFVGRHAMAAFARAVAPAGRVSGLGREAMPDVPAGTTYHRCDLLDGPGLTRLVAGLQPSHVLHLAGLSSVQQASADPARAWQVNCVGLLNLCEAVGRGARGATFLHVSSGEVYGRAFLCGTAVNEATAPLPATSYALTKRVGEQMLGDILPAYGVRAVILRPFNHIGPGQDERFVAASFAGQIARIEAGHAEPALRVGDLSAQRDFLDVEDVVAAYLAVAERAEVIASGSTFNVASGRARPISDILDGLRTLARVPFEVQIDRSRLRAAEIPVASGDASALAHAVGWTPRIRWEDTLANTLEDARARHGAPSLRR